MPGSEGDERCFTLQGTLQRADEFGDGSESEEERRIPIDGDSDCGRNPGTGLLSQVARLTATVGPRRPDGVYRLDDGGSTNGAWFND